MSERFFISPPIAGERATLKGDEARHLAAVMRAQVGDEITLLDGSGAEFTAQVISIGKQTVELAIMARVEITRELPFELTLAVALPKGERQKWLVEKATELGVTRFVPLASQRGVAQPVEAALERLRRSVIEASKQSGRNRLMEISPPVTTGQLFSATPSAPARLVADPSGAPLSSSNRHQGKDLIAAIGPEGGFAPEELAAARSAGWEFISLGPRILRVETAALAVAAWAST